MHLPDQKHQKLEKQVFQIEPILEKAPGSPFLASSSTQFFFIQIILLEHPHNNLIFFYTLLYNY